MRRSVFLSLALCAVCTSGFAEITYKVVPQPDQNKLIVSVTVPNHGDSTSFQIPNWGPGSYRYGYFWKNVQDVSVTDSKSVSLIVSKPNDYTWSVSGGEGPITITYSLANTATDGSMGYSGPATYMYVVDRKQEPCLLTIDAPKGWPIYTGLDNADGKANEFTAPTYDVLADNPVSMGDLLVDTYVVRGKTHYIVLRGKPRDQIDRAFLLKACKQVSAEETDFFGVAPYHKYVWHFAVTPAADGAGGLEHLSSTQISIAKGVGPRAQSVLSHEFFHLWNVKRIRAKVLGPFDYTTLPKTGNLWWLEGVTDYYAWYLPMRYGWWGATDYEKRIGAEVDRVRSVSARLEVSPYQASYRVSEADNGMGNSNGYKISYYDLGWLCGMCLDLEIRSQTGNKHSLDDVEHALWDMCKDNKPGFEEDEIRKQCIRFGGPALGPFFDKVVMSPGELPVEEEIAKIGLKLVDHEATFVKPGFTWSVSRTEKGATVDTVDASAAKLEKGDLIVSMNGVATDLNSGREVNQAMNTATAKDALGTPIRLEVMRNGERIPVEVTPVQGTRIDHLVEEDPAAGADAVKLRGQYLAQKKAAEQ